MNTTYTVVGDGGHVMAEGDEFAYVVLAVVAARNEDRDYKVLRTLGRSLSETVSDYELENLVHEAAEKYGFDAGAW